MSKSTPHRDAALRSPRVISAENVIQRLAVANPICRRSRMA
jgi:hypothetical protein